MVSGRVCIMAVADEAEVGPHSSCETVVVKGGALYRVAVEVLSPVVKHCGWSAQLGEEVGNAMSEGELCEVVEEE